VTGTGSAGQVAYWSSGSAITGETNLFWDTTNDRLGVGTNTPSGILNVAGSNDAHGNTGIPTIPTLFLNRCTTSAINYAGLIITTDAASSNFGLYSNQNGALFYHGDTERWRITSTGVLQSNGLQTIQTSTGNLTIATGGGNGNILLTPNGTGYVDVKSFIQIDNYAAGTTVPNTAGLLKILSGSKTGWAPNDELGKIEFYGTDTSGIGPRNLASIRAVNSTGNGTTTTTSNGELAFYTSVANSLEAERLRINSIGDIGIGTATPNIGTLVGTVLTINGATQSNLEMASAGASRARIASSSTDTTFETRSALPLVFGTDSTARWQITSTGVLQSPFQ
jgi:hypothetical protein